MSKNTPPEQKGSIIISQQNPAIMPSVDLMIADALLVVQKEVARYKTTVERGHHLNLTEAKILQGYIKSLVDLSKEDRERVKDMDLSNMSTEELIKLLGEKEVLKALNPAKEK